MAQSLVQALEGLNFPCDRAHILEFAQGHDISPRAMDFLRRLPEQPYASIEELFTVLPSKGSLRNLRHDVGPDPAPEPLPPQPAMPAAPDEERNRDLPAMAERRGVQLDPFGLTCQWQQAWLKGVESYTRLFMPWLRH